MEEQNIRKFQPRIFLTPDLLAERLGVSVITLQGWRTRKQGPRFIKLPKKVLYPLEEIEAWEKDQLRSSTAG